MSKHGQLLSSTLLIYSSITKVCSSLLLLVNCSSTLLIISTAGHRSARQSTHQSLLVNLVIVLPYDQSTVNCPNHCQLTITCQCTDCHHHMLLQKFAPAQSLNLGYILLLFISVFMVHLAEYYIFCR